jgi:hypothetical protein
MLNLLATLVVSTLPLPAGAVPACAAPMAGSAEAAAAGASAAAASAVAVAVECHVAAPLDLWYRMSRFADADPGSVGAGPARRLKPNAGMASCDAPQPQAQWSPPQTAPVALFALPSLLAAQVPSHFDADAHALPARALAPPDRPPRV